ILAIAFHPDGGSVATAGADSTVRTWEIASGAEQAVYRGLEGRATALAYHPDGRSLASGGQQPGVVKVWDLTRPFEYSLPLRLGEENKDVEGLTFAQDGALAA